MVKVIVKTTLKIMRMESTLWKILGTSLKKKILSLTPRPRDKDTVFPRQSTGRPGQDLNLFNYAAHIPRKPAHVEANHQSLLSSVDFPMP